MIEVAQAHGDSHIRPLEIDLINIKRKITTDLQIIQQQRATVTGRVDVYRPPDVCAFINFNLKNGNFYCFLNLQKVYIGIRRLCVMKKSSRIRKF